MKTKPTSVLLAICILAGVAGWYLGYRDENPTASATARDTSRELGHPTNAKPAPLVPATSAGPTATASEPEEAGRALLPEFVWKAPPALPNLPSIATAEKKVQAVALLENKAVPSFIGLKIGEAVDFSLGGTHLRGRVRQIIPNDEGRAFIAGSLNGAGAGNFALGQDLKTGEKSGHIIDRAGKAGYELKATAGGLEIRKKPLDAVVCLMPRYRGPSPAPTTTRSAPQAITVPVLNSRSSAAGVLLLDFDGAAVIDPDWNYGVTIIAAPATIGTSPISSAQITDVWRRVAEDFRSLDLNVTTDQAKYDAAPTGHRARCIITPTDSWYGGYAGGVAYLKSYRGTSAGYSTTIPCWCWNNNTTAVMAMTISHELGHMLDLSHDGAPFDEYYAGHDSGVIGWGPLMGAPFDKPITQWSKGEYPGANNIEDDYDVMRSTISESLSVTGGVADDVGGTRATAKALPIAPPINQPAAITSVTDVDYFSFKSNGGSYTFNAQPDMPEANLDPLLELYDSTGTLLATAPQTTTTLVATVTGNLPGPGTYYLAVSSRGRPASTGVIGYTNYGSQGAYTLTGVYVPLPEAPLVVVQPASVVANQGAKVSLAPQILSNSPMLHQWYKIVNGNDVKLSGKTSSTLAFSSLQPADAGDYKLITTNRTGSSTTDVANIDVHFKPVVKTQPLPAKQTVREGSNVVFNSVVEGTAPMTYQWKKNGVNLAGETGTSLTLNAVDWFDAGSYTVTITNALGYRVSSAAVLVVGAKPVFTQEPSPVVKPIALGGTGSMTVKTLGTATITYQWFKDGSPIPKATKSTYSWSNTQLLAEGTYFVRATNAIGPQDSASFTVDVQDRPVIDLPQTPSAITLAADQPFALDCTAHGTGPLIYQWQLNGINVADNAPNVQGTTTPNLRIANISWLHRGTWRCVVSNAVGTAITKNCTLSITSYPVIITQPLDTKIAKNGTGTLKVVAGGSPTLKYQWYKDGNLIPKATAASLVLSKASPLTTSGSYYVIVSNTQPLPTSGPVTSRSATVTVEDPPLVAAALPASQTVGIGDTVTISVSATGSPTLRYQWQKNSVNIVGETSSTLTLTNVQTKDSALYRAVVTNDVGRAYSAAARVTVLTRPTIITDPLSQTVYAWDSPTLIVKANGSPTLKYQWYKDGNAITSKSNSSAITSTLKLPNVQESQAGTYAVVVSNAVGSVFSADAILTVNPVPSPTLTDVRPSLIVYRDRIMVTGTNLNWTTKVTLGGKACSFIKSRSTLLWVTAPSSGLPSSSELTVNTRGGTVTWPTPIGLIVSLASENDDFLNAKVVLGSEVYTSSDNTYATVDYYGEPSTYSNDWGYRYRSVWFRWRAAFTGTARFNSYGTRFHHAVFVYSGPQLPMDTTTLRLAGNWENHFGFDPADTSYYDIKVTKDTDYYIQFFSAHSSGQLPLYGWCNLAIYIPKYAPKPMAKATFDAADGYASGKALDGQNEWQADGPANGVSTTADGGTGFIGGPGKSASVVAASLPITNGGPEHPIVRASAEFKITSQPGVDEEFSWGLYARDGCPVLAAVFEMANGGVSVDAGGTEVKTDQVFVPGADYAIEMLVDQHSDAWSVSLNGTVIASGSGLGLAVDSLSHIAAGWRPSVTQPNRGVMNFDNVLVNAETTGEEQVDTPREAPATTPVVSPEPVEEGTQE